MGTTKENTMTFNERVKRGIVIKKGYVLTVNELITKTWEMESDLDWWSIRLWVGRN